MTDLGTDAIAALLDRAHIARAAGAAAYELTHTRHAAIRLEPGDATVYWITVLHPDEWWPAPEPGRRPWSPGGAYVVALVDTAGRAYPWTGDPVHPNYAAEKWAAGHVWTGVVVAEFLTALAAELARE